MRNILLITIGFAALGTLFVANAGPPLICHPYNIGGAKSLPWSSGNNWDNPDPSYNLKNLASETVAILDRTPTVLVRMETLRRAVVYGSRDHDAARTLLAQLKAREAASETSKPPSPAAILDYGYFLSSLKRIVCVY